MLIPSEKAIYLVFTATVVGGRIHFYVKCFLIVTPSPLKICQRGQIPVRSVQKGGSKRHFAVVTNITEFYR